MAMKTFAPFQLDTLFEGDLSSTYSESDSSTTPVPSVARSSPKHANSRKGSSAIKTPRPRRQEPIKSYAESDTDEKSIPANLSSKRKRNGSHNGSPTKKVKIDIVQSPRGHRFSSGQVPSRSATKNVAALSASWSGVNGEPVASISLEGYWWPAKKLSTSDETEDLVYQLYGDDGRGSGRTVIIKTPRTTNMQSIYYPKPPLPRYSPSSFQQGSAINSSSFLEALNQLNQDDDETDDEYSLQEEVTVSEGEHAPPSQSSAVDWRPPSPSEFESVIDQRVLCKSKRGSAVHWPARVTAYIPPTKSSQKPRFEVNFFDWKTTEVTRDMFFTQYDDDEKAFGTCEVDRRKLHEWIHKNTFSPEEGGDDTMVDITNLPEPCFPIPKPAMFIEQMPIEKQFVYVIPFMRRILEETYAPSQERTDAWMKGGSARIGITSNPIQGGNLAEVEWHLFGRLVHNWAVPGLKASDLKRLDDAGSDPHLPLTDVEISERPRGSERYEGLPLPQKLQFVFDVLIGEAVIQLLIIRAGKRSDLNLLSHSEETELYKYGLEMSLQESTSIMVRTVLESRREIRKRLGLFSEPLIAASTTLETETEIGSRRSRVRIVSK